MAAVRWQIVGYPFCLILKEARMFRWLLGNFFVVSTVSLKYIFSFTFLFLFVFLTLTVNANSNDDFDKHGRYTIYAYLKTMSGKNDALILAMLSYFGGIRDHLYWQCEYEISVPEMRKFLEFHLNVTRSSMSDDEWNSFIRKTPVCDMIFIMLKVETLTQRKEPCK